MAMLKFWWDGGFQDPERLGRRSPVVSTPAWRSVGEGGLEGWEKYEPWRGEGAVQEVRWL